MNDPSVNETGASGGSFFQSVAAHYLLWVVPAIIALLGGFGFFMYRLERVGELRKHAEMVHIITEKTNQALIQWINSQIRLAQTLAADPRVSALCRRPLDPEVRQQAQDYLSSMHRIVPYCENLPVAIRLPPNEHFELTVSNSVRKIGNGNFIIDTVDGRTIGKCGPQFSYIREVFDSREYFISEVYPSILRGNPIFVVAAPIREENRILGALIVAPRMDYFTDFFLNEAHIGDTGYLIMLDERGLVISHPKKEWILNEEAGRLMTPIMERIRGGQTQFELTFEGRRKLYTVARFSSEQFNILHGWYIISCREYDEVIAEAKVQFHRTLLFMSVLGLLVIVLLVGLTNRLVCRPLTALTRAAGRVSDGDLQGDVARSTRKDEIGALSRAFGRMTCSLQEQTRMIRESVNMLEQAAKQINDVCIGQERTVQENKTTTAEVAASVHQISATSRELAATMQSVREISASTESGADTGRISLDRLSETMQRLLTATGEISRKLVAIHSKAASIGSVITAITKVADQTNLLSLNAGIEAEKAGEYGVGFAVVAREIRRLSDQTAQSTLDIERIIREMQHAVGTGVKEMDRFVDEVKAGADVAGEAGRRLGTIIEQVKAMTPRFEQVNAGMHEQSQGASGISEAMQQISEGAVHTTEALARIRKAAEDLRRAAAGLQQQVARFRI